MSAPLPVQRVQLSHQQWLQEFEQQRDQEKVQKTRDLSGLSSLPGRASSELEQPHLLQDKKVPRNQNVFDLDCPRMYIGDRQWLGSAASVGA
ncbi:hypothetical protein D3C87_1345170 [compost metagenome]